MVVIVSESEARRNAMSTTEMAASGVALASDEPRGPLGDGAVLRPRDLQQTCRLALATAWLLDAVLQIQPFMFTHGPGGFSGTLRAGAAGNPSWIAHTITRNATIVDHHPVLTNSLFAGIQFLIGFGIAWSRTTKQALVLSIAWSIGVWWFGEGLGGIFHGQAIPLGGGPGGVLFYGLLAVLLWPALGSDRPFVAARAIGVAPAKITWTITWIVLAVLSVVGSGRSPQSLRDLVADMEGGEPGWLVHLDRSSESLLFHHGMAISISLAVASALLALAVYLPPRGARVLLGLATVVSVVIWVTVQDFGGIPTGRATDPGSAPLIVLLISMYWPLKASRLPPTGTISREQAQ
jgi:hypothetical protein